MARHSLQACTAEVDLILGTVNMLFTSCHILHVIVNSIVSMDLMGMLRTGCSGETGLALHVSTSS